MAWDKKFRSQQIRIADTKENLGGNVDEDTIITYPSLIKVPSALARYMMVYPSIGANTMCVITTKKLVSHFQLGKYLEWQKAIDAEEAEAQLEVRLGEPEDFYDPDEQPNPYENDPPDPPIWNPPL
jgi:hypothetical protein